MEKNSNVYTNSDAEKASVNKKIIWGVALILFFAVIMTAAVFVSNVKKLVPTENDNVIALMPIDAEELTEESEVVFNSVSDIKVASPNLDASKEKVQVQVPKSKGGMNTTYTLGRSNQQQVGIEKAEIQVEDDAQIWQSETKVDIFDEAYHGTDNEITVENKDGENLIAPGTENDYTFWVKNTGKTDIDYWVSFEEKETEGYDIPLEVRVKCGDNYIFGTQNTWEPVEKLNSVKHEGHLREKNYAKYTLEWRWYFENDDAYDTYLGDEAVGKDIMQEIIIHTYGEGYDRPIYENFDIADAFTAITGGVKTGDNENIVVYIILMAAALAVMCFQLGRKKKNESKEQEN